MQQLVVVHTVSCPFYAHFSTTNAQIIFYFSFFYVDLSWSRQGQGFGGVCDTGDTPGRYIILRSWNTRSHPLQNPCKSIVPHVLYV